MLAYEAQVFCSGKNWQDTAKYADKTDENFCAKGNDELLSGGYSIQWLNSLNI